MVHKLLGRAVLTLTLAMVTSCALPSGGAISPTMNHSDVQFVDDAGKSHAISGKAATFVFWQPWCGSCREEAPATVAASIELAETMSFYGVVSGPDDAVDEELYLKSIRELGLSYPQIRDKDLSLAKRFAVTQAPTIIVVDAAGQLRFTGSHMPENLAAIK